MIGVRTAAFAAAVCMASSSMSQDREPTTAELAASVYKRCFEVTRVELKLYKAAWETITSENARGLVDDDLLVRMDRTLQRHLADVAKRLGGKSLECEDLPDWP